MVTAASAQTLDVEIGSGTRAVSDFHTATNQAAYRFNRNMEILTRQNRAQRAMAGNYNPNIPISFPTTIWLTSNGKRLPGNTTRSARPFTLAMSLDFTGSGFDTAEQNFLQSVYDQAQPFLDANFGSPQITTVKIKRNDSLSGTREFVTGGYFVPNAGTPEINFPSYGLDRKEVAAINFIHCLLLAYHGTSQYGYDAFNEGLVRAVTMKLARNHSAMVSGLFDDVIESVLSNGYDVEAYYDWYNQRALGGSKFIAPNLRDDELPVFGSVGGLYLLRYRMAGSAWQKVLVEYPAFAANFNNAFYSNPSIASNVPALVALAQTTLNGIQANAKVEGLDFADWFARQFILETHDTRGPKLLVEPVPGAPINSSDFGVFIIQANWFETTAGGDETLLSGTSYPILWEGPLALSRIFGTAQDDRMDIAGGYGAIAPNLDDINGGAIYRAVVDVPVADQLERVYLPVGAIATASNPTFKDFFGTVVGANLQVGDVLRLTVTVNGAPVADVPIVNNAFGVTLGTATPAYLDSAKIVVNVVRKRATVDTILLTRKVNKGPGNLALDLRIGSEATYNFTSPLPKGIAMVGFPIDPFASLNSAILGIADNQVLAARYDSSKARYILYPDLEPFKVGHGYFIRSETAVNPFSVTGRVYQNIQASVALKPGWNMVSCPLTSTVATTQMRVIRAANPEFIYSESIGIDIGTDFFEFTPGTNDTASGVPETGTLSPATSFVPGKAYFFRVLAPEGITLTFAPTSFTGLSVSKLMATTATPSTWQMALDMTYGTKLKARAVIGQSPTATRSFDAKEDSGMPPGIGGFQVIAENYEALYRDIRPVGQETYVIHLQGLVKGKAHKLAFTMLKGTTGTFTLKDGTGKVIGTSRPGFAYNFVPKSADEWIQIVIGGGK